MPEKFVEQAKHELFYETEGGTDDVKLMLSQGPANSRVNEEMGRLMMAVTNIDSNWRGPWKGLFSQWYQDLQEHYMNLNGYSRVQAIEIAGQRASAESEYLQKKERGGILGLFSGGKK